jgi:hypothetical protein
VQLLLYCEAEELNAGGEKHIREMAVDHFRDLISIGRCPTNMLALVYQIQLYGEVKNIAVKCPE